MLCRSLNSFRNYLLVHKPKFINYEQNTKKSKYGYIRFKLNTVFDLRKVNFAVKALKICFLINLKQKNQIFYNKLFLSLVF